MRANRLAWFGLIGLGCLIAGGLWWHGRGRVEVEGTLREGSLRCDDECRFELVLDGPRETRVRVASCIMPDTLRDWPGEPLHVMAAGSWEGEGQLLASALLTRESYAKKPHATGGRPASCFIPARP